MKQRIAGDIWKSAEHREKEVNLTWPADRTWPGLYLRGGEEQEIENKELNVRIMRNVSSWGKGRV